MAKVIAVATQKGGVGKSTTCLELAAVLSIEHDKKVLIIDFDPQVNQSMQLDQTKCEKTIYDSLHEPGVIKEAIVHFKNYDFIPASSALSKADTEFNRSDDAFLLDDALDYVKDDYDFIVIDSGPQRNKLFEMIYVAADYVIAPSENTEFGIGGLLNVHEDIEKLKNARIPLSKAVLIGTVLTRYRENTNVAKAAKEILENVMKQINDKAFVVTISEAAVVDEVKFVHKSLQEYAPYSKPAIDYQILTNAVLEYIKKEEEQ